MLGVTVPPGLRPQAYHQHFETIETQVALEPVEPVEAREERADIAVIGPIAALVLVLTICTLILDHPAARAVAAGLATFGLIVSVILMVLGKRPQPGRHVARHAVDRRPG